MTVVSNVIVAVEADNCMVLEIGPAEAFTNALYTPSLPMMDDKLKWEVLLGKHSVKSGTNSSTLGVSTGGAPRVPPLRAGFPEG